MPSKSIGYYETLLQSNNSHCKEDSHIEMCVVGFSIASDGYIEDLSYKLVFFCFFISNKYNLVHYKLIFVAK